MPSLPKITPIPFIERAAPFDDPNFIFQLKYDGFTADDATMAIGASQQPLAPRVMTMHAVRKTV